MKLLRLRVAHFGCVQAAEVPFGPNLNVLHGRNDLGKSSLVAAVRAALLLQHGSREHERHVTWNRANRPEVELTLQTEPQRYYRIRKAFGSQGTSILEYSTDGQSFRTEAKGRKVDGMIRNELLRWGIPEPGGRSGRKGMPVSFLATTLLGQQDSVTDIFAAQLGNDPDDSGKKRLVDALQATARDPFFTAILNDAQAEVDKAFSSTGRRRTARGSPFKRVGDEIKKVRGELEGLAQDAAAGERIRERLAGLEQERLATSQERDDARDRQGTLAQIVAKENELTRARQELAETEERIAAAERATADCVAAEKRCDELQSKRDQLERAVQAAREERDTARDSLRAIELQESRARERVQACELDIAGVDKALQAARDRKGLAVQVQQGDDACQTLDRDIAAIEASLATMDGERASCRAALAKLEPEIQLLAGVALWLRWRELEPRLEKSRETAIELATLVAEAERAEKTAGELAARFLARGLPTPDTMERLRELQDDLRGAEAALQVGLSVIIESATGLEIAVSRDDSDMEDMGEVRGSTELSATRELRLSLADLASVRILGGTPRAQERYRQARERWRQHSEPVFETAGVDSLSGLEERVAEARRDIDHLYEMGREEERSEEQFEVGRQKLANDASLRRDAADLQKQLADYDLDALARRGQALLAHEGLPRDPGERLQREREAVAHEIQAQRDTLNEIDKRKAVKEAQRDSLREQLDQARTQRGVAVAKLEIPWQEALDEAERQIVALEAQLAELEERKESVVAKSDSEREESAQAGLAAAETRLSKAEDAHKSLSEKLGNARTEAARLDGELESKTDAARHASPGQAWATVDALSAELAELRGALGLDPESPAGTGEQLAAAEQVTEQLARAVRGLENDIHVAEGELRRTGGARAREQADDMQKHLQGLEKKQRDTERDYDAWKLLRDTLRNVEKEQAAHLGRLLVDPITEQFQQLTGGRYGAMALGPDLETQGIHAGGDRRDIAVLSIGTKEQLCALFRLSVAERLGSAVLLDDQLTQTDPERMGWFRTKLREISRTIQIIVLTCRARDYLEEHEIAGNPGDVSSVPLDQVIVRA